MQLIAARTRLIMLITGVITFTTIYAVFAPQAALMSLFGASLTDGALTEIIVRSWGTLVALIGAMLIYGAFKPKERPLILTIAGVSKLIFVGLLLLFGSQYLPKITSLIALDSVSVILFAICLPNALNKSSFNKTNLS